MLYYSCSGVNKIKYTQRHIRVQEKIEYFFHPSHLNGRITIRVKYILLFYILTATTTMVLTRAYGLNHLEEGGGSFTTLAVIFTVINKYKYLRMLLKLVSREDVISLERILSPRGYNYQYI